MDTKWKKSKIWIGMLAFFLGMTLLIYNFISMLTLISNTDLRQSDYQKTQEFATTMSNRLEDLIGIGLRGKDWMGYQYSYSDSGYRYDFYAADTVTEDSGTVISEWWTPDYSGSVSYEEAATEAGGYSTANFNAYLEEMKADQNLRYAVFKDGKLIYTNIDGLDAENASIGMDFAAWIPAEEYNFQLTYNKDGDGKVAMEKDGQTVDVYGDGIYRENSRWAVPGYQNFTVGDEAKAIVVYLAAAKAPKLYVVSGTNGTNRYGGVLYRLKESLAAERQQLARSKAGLAAALLLLLLAWMFRKPRRAGREIIARWTGKIWLEIKLLIFLVLPICLLLILINEFLTWSSFSPGWVVYYGIEDYAPEALDYLAFNRNGIFTCLFLIFWPLYLGITDLRRNQGQQKIVMGRLRRSISTRELEQPVQKKLVKWQRRSLIPFVGFFYVGKVHRLAEDLGALTEQIGAVRGGDMGNALSLPEDSDLKAAAEDLNSIQEGMEAAIRERTKSERMKVELVANVSHDIKTPLTSIVSYVDILKQEENLPEDVKDYIRVLGEKSERLSAMVQDVFEVSKAASGELQVKPEKLDFAKLLRQTLADMAEPIEQSGLSMRVSISEEPVMITADGQRMYRVFQNLLQNALKYSLPGSRVYLTLVEKDGNATAVMKNTSATELGDGIDFTERFVRGDKSRTDGGSGLGLSIAKSFTEACGGSFRVETDADLFTAVVSFAVTENKKEA